MHKLAVLIIVAVLSTPALRPPMERLGPFEFAPLIDVTTTLGAGFTQRVGGFDIDRACNGYDRQSCARACGSSRTSSCMGVTGGIRYCSACIDTSLLTQVEPDTCDPANEV